MPNATAESVHPCRIAQEVPQVTPVVLGDAPHVLSLTMEGATRGESLVRVLGDQGGLCVRRQCLPPGQAQPVYAALGCPNPRRDRAFRVSFCGAHHPEEVDQLIDGLKFAAQTLFPSMS